MCQTLKSACPSSLIGVFLVRMKKLCILDYLKCPSEDSDQTASMSRPNCIFADAYVLRYIFLMLLLIFYLSSFLYADKNVKFTSISIVSYTKTCQPLVCCIQIFADNKIKHSSFFTVEFVQISTAGSEGLKKNKKK